jgi:poly-gamma-glutamate synthesis protein (capsule biosynthesis protein)
MSLAQLNLFAVGDISLKTKSNGNPFSYVENLLSRKNILFGNLETVLSNNGKKSQKSSLYYSSPEKAALLNKAGFDVVNIANNHIMDLGEEGFNETIDVLSQNGIKFIGARNQKFKQSYIIIEKKGIKIGFLGYYEGGRNNFGSGIHINRMDEHNICRDIKKVKTKTDIVVISLHWGIENVFYPSPDQIRFARSLIDNGADIILGHHPHFLQGIERYKHGLIAYSLGNFQFNCDTAFRSKRFKNESYMSLILVVQITKDQIRNFEIVPVRIDDNSPQLMQGKEKNELIKLLNRISKPISSNLIFENWWFEQINCNYLIGNLESWMRRIKKYGIIHFFQFVRWLIHPFNIKCYLAVVRSAIKRI